MSDIPAKALYSETTAICIVLRYDKTLPIGKHAKQIVSNFSWGWQGDPGSSLKADFFLKCLNEIVASKMKVHHRCWQGREACII